MLHQVLVILSMIGVYIQRGDYMYAVKLFSLEAVQGKEIQAVDKLEKDINNWLKQKEREVINISISNSDASVTHGTVDTVMHSYFVCVFYKDVVSVN